MPQETDRLKLPLPLGNENVTRESINGIFEKIDAGVATQADLDALREAVSKMDIPDASLTQKGKVQLSSKTDGTSETVAATEKAVRDARVAAETNAKNASLLRTGGDISGPLTVSSWGSISAGTSGFFLMGHNCYIHPTNNKYYYKQTHSNMGARGIVFRLGQAGVYTFDTGPISTMKDSEFTPALIRMPTQTDYDALFQSVSDGKATIAAAITGKGVTTSGSDTFLQLSNNISKIRTGVFFNNLSYWKSQKGTVQGTNGFFVTDNIITIPSGIERVSFISRQKVSSIVSVSYSSDTLLEGIIAIRNIDASANPYASGNVLLYSGSGYQISPLRLLDIDFVNREITVQVDDENQYISTRQMDKNLNNKSPIIIYAAFYFRNAAGGSYYVDRSISVSLSGRLYYG